MVMVSSVVIFAFAVIFTTTYTRVQNEINDKLVFARPQRSLDVFGAAFRPGGVVYPEPGFFSDGPSGVVRRVLPDAGLSFSVFVDSQNEVIEIDSMMDMDYETYAMMALQAMGAADSTDALNVDGRMWRYMITPISMISREIDEATSTVFIMSNDLNHIRFLDVTDSYRTIRSLAFTLSAMLIAILAVFFFFSRYFANRAIKPMAQAWEKQNRFITDASHELKTPLSVINANCGVLYADKDETVGSQLKWVDSIMRSADRMAGLVSSMLSLVSMEDAQLELSKCMFDLSGAVSEAADEIEAPAFEKGLEIRREIQPGVEIESDREHICKILSILLDNAIKYTGSGGEIVVSLEKEGKLVTCAVRNSGQGVPAEELPYLFDRFYRGDPARSPENSGYGLGLSIAKAIASQLGAELTAKSVSGQYTEFRLVLDR